MSLNPRSEELTTEQLQLMRDRIVAMSDTQVLFRYLMPIARQFGPELIFVIPQDLEWSVASDDRVYYQTGKIDYRTDRITVDDRPPTADELRRAATSMRDALIGIDERAFRQAYYNDFSQAPPLRTNPPRGRRRPEPEVSRGEPLAPPNPALPYYVPR